MTRINLTGGEYLARSPIAAAQRQLNYYSEPLPRPVVSQDDNAAGSGEPAPYALYPTPGMDIIVSFPAGPVRGIHQGTDGRIYVVAGNVVYVFSAHGPPWIGTALGTISVGPTTPVSMADNGLQLVIVDGTGNGWTYTYAGGVFAVIVDPTGTFVGATRVEYLDTYFLFRGNGTKSTMIASKSSLIAPAIAFDPLYFVSKSANSDNLVSIAVVKREVWLLGLTTSEVFFNNGAAAGAGFPFASVQGVFIDHGVHALYSVATIDNSVFWLSSDRYGAPIVLQGAGYAAKKVSSFAIDAMMLALFQLYPIIGLTDAVGYTYQMGGHGFYVLTFPAADITICYDISTALWHELCWLDGSNVEHRHRGNCAASGFGQVFVGDWQTAALYVYNLQSYTDNTGPVKRVRSFPHIEGKDGNRLAHNQFLANVEVGTTTGAAPTIQLDWSDDRGVTFGNPLSETLGAAGAGQTSVQFQRLGMARSRVYRLTTTATCPVALLGAFVDVTEASS